MLHQWQALQGRVDQQRYEEVLKRLEYQAGHAQVWRDAICNWFLRRSGIPDEQGRVGNYPNRLEAEDQQLEGYTVTNIAPWEAASSSRAIQLVEEDSGSVRFRHSGRPGTFALRVQYFDEEDGVSKYKLFVGDRLLDEWSADNHLPTPTTLPDSHSSIRRTVPGVKLQPGEEIRIEGQADDGERAGIDYVEIVPAAHFPSFQK
jgi:alpha-glucuronidase